MKISPINYYPKLTTPSFSEYSTSEYTDNVKYYTTTEWFRDDFDIDALLFYANSMYKDTQKVNVISYGCSDGEETYSLALKLKMLPLKDSEKYLPLIAKDIDHKCITLAKRGRYKISDREAFKIEKNGDYKLYRYVNLFDDGLEKYVFVRDALKNDINFDIGDICKDIDNIPRKNTILLCRNFWPYLLEKNRIELADKLGKYLDESSLVVTGSFDVLCDTTNLLKTKGFEETGIPGVMRKSSK